MEWLFEILGGFWFWGCDGRTKAADASDSYILPILLAVAAICAIALFCIR